VLYASLADLHAILQNLPISFYPTFPLKQYQYQEQVAIIFSKCSTPKNLHCNILTY